MLRLIVVVGVENRAVGLCHVNEPSARLPTFQRMRSYSHLFPRLQALPLNAGATERDGCLGCDPPFDRRSSRLWHHDLNEGMRVGVGELLHRTRHLHFLVLVEHDGGVVSDRRQRGGAEETDDGNEAWSEAIDHCSLFFLVFSCYARTKDPAEASPRR